METKIIKNLIKSYFDVVRKNLNDIVPKTVMSFLVNKSKNQAQKELVSSLYNSNSDLKTLLKEDAETVRKREAVVEMVKTLKQSLAYLSDIRDYQYE